ncbi:hypothetical protein HanXRQr2_Chr10g0452021 [Helianthus annuus]|uniref:Uncharacterized protein n=1 Tax=Helianthus annuus TaxID=4232 RepID=A0A9K3HZJ7_HELAN|nr:hypothetical protein HanXRQr2_Chr10g0452021 [Helianthus annuus]
MHIQEQATCLTILIPVMIVVRHARSIPCFIAHIDIINSVALPNAFRSASPAISVYKN